MHEYLMTVTDSSLEDLRSVAMILGYIERYARAGFTLRGERGRNPCFEPSRCLDWI